MTSAEAQAIRTDARARLNELQAVRQLLLPDRDDPAVLSELTTIQSSIDSCERILCPRQP
jgi:hypothetical protein